MIDIQEHFVPEKVSEIRKWKILRLDQATVASAIRRRPAATSDVQSSAAPPCPPSLPACRDLSTWASNRDLCQWISKFRFLSIIILKVLTAEAQLFPRRQWEFIVFKSTKELVMMNPFLPVSDSSSTKGGAGHSLSPSLSRFKNKFSTQRQFSSQKIEHCCNTNRRSLFVQTSLSNIFHSAQPS